MRKLNRLMEHFWLAVAIGTALAAAWMIWADGYEASKQWLLIAAIPLAMWAFRRMMRGKLEAMDDRAKEKRGQ
ncbi:MAG TPA: hypothetical protein PK760_01610 [Flavobacteriales bacterium]|nr:hypothetical protein [Flavobacteriales bacterium]